MLSAFLEKFLVGVNFEEGPIMAKKGPVLNTNRIRHKDSVMTFESFRTLIYAFMNFTTLMMLSLGSS